MKEARIYYLSSIVAIMDDPYDWYHPVVVLRHPGPPSVEDWRAINDALRTSNMKLVGNSSYREDGLWYHPVREV